MIRGLLGFSARAKDAADETSSRRVGVPHHTHARVSQWLIFNPSLLLCLCRVGVLLLVSEDDG